jgi:hypothetical protein
MNQQIYRKSFMVGAVAIGVIAGAAVGFFTAHGMMETGSVSAAPVLAGEMADMGAGGVSAPPGHRENGLSEQAGGVRVKTSGEMGGMKGMSMEQMDMKKMAPAGEKSMEGMPGMSARRPGRGGSGRHEAVDRGSKRASRLCNLGARDSCGRHSRL